MKHEHLVLAKKIYFLNKDSSGILLSKISHPLLLRKWKPDATLIQC